MRNKAAFYRITALMLLLGLAIIPLVSISSGAPLQQLDPTQEQQTIDAVVQQRIQQTAQAQQQIALTRTVEVALNQALTATAWFESTVSAQIGAAQTSTQQAGIQATRQAILDSIVVQDFDGVPMVLVPAGCFMMGSGREAHEQCFDQPFWIDQTEVTQAQFARLGGVKANVNRFTGDQRPVERITWFEARDFCALRGARLPTEAEWEYAARGPDNLVYPWGNEFIADNVVYRGNSGYQTANVGSRPGGASWVGALDMSGNVGEWTGSLYEPYPYDATDGREADTVNRRNVLSTGRGGSFGDTGDDLRAAGRNYRYPDYVNLNIGYRCARSR